MLMTTVTIAPPHSTGDRSPHSCILEDLKTGVRIAPLTMHSTSFFLSKSFFLPSLCRSCHFASTCLYFSHVEAFHWKFDHFSSLLPCLVACQEMYSYRLCWEEKAENDFGNFIIRRYTNSTSVDLLPKETSSFWRVTNCVIWSMMLGVS